MNDANPQKKTRRARVLVVDDEKLVRRLLTQFLTRLGHTATTAEDGAAALDQLSPELDLIYLDCELPGMDGVEVARRIREQPAYQTVPIIMITGHRDRDTRIRALEAGVSEFLLKPFDQVELRLRTETLLELRWSREDLERQRTSLESMVAERSAAVNHALREVERQRDRLRQAHLDTLERLALAAEYKDQDTASHIQRVGAFCALLATNWGCPRSEVELIWLASPLHDVGKLGIPDEILMAPRKLTAEEWEVMQGHAVIGARILRGSGNEVLQAAEEIALTHHEWWNGGGYPRGLSEEEIPLPGRITAVADVFDALTSRRPYKKAFSNEEALEIMRKGRGKQFQPELLDLLESQMEAVTQIQRDHSEDQDRSLSDIKGSARIATPPRSFTAWNPDGSSRSS